MFISGFEFEVQEAKWDPIRKLSCKISPQICLTQLTLWRKSGCGLADNEKFFKTSLLSLLTHQIQSRPYVLGLLFVTFYFYKTVMLPSQFFVRGPFSLKSVSVDALYIRSDLSLLRSGPLRVALLWSARASSASVVVTACRIGNRFTESLTLIDPPLEPKPKREELSLARQPVSQKAQGSLNYN